MNRSFHHTVALLALAATSFSCRSTPPRTSHDATDPPREVVPIGQLRTRSLPVSRAGRAWFSRASLQHMGDGSTTPSFYIGTQSGNDPAIECLVSEMPWGLVPTSDGRAVFFLTTDSQGTSLWTWMPPATSPIAVLTNEPIEAIGAHRGSLAIVTRRNDRITARSVPLQAPPVSAPTLLGEVLIPGSDMVAVVIDDDHVGFSTRSNRYHHLGAGGFAPWPYDPGTCPTLARADHLLALDAHLSLSWVDAQGQVAMQHNGQPITMVKLLLEQGPRDLGVFQSAAQTMFVDCSAKATSVAAPPLAGAAKALVAAPDLWTVCGDRVWRLAHGVWQGCSFSGPTPAAPTLLCATSSGVVVADGDTAIQLDATGHETARATLGGDPIAKLWWDGSTIWLLTASPSTGDVLNNVRLYRW